MKTIYFISLMILLLLVSGCGKGFSEGGYFADGKALANETKAGITEISRDDLIKAMERKVIMDTIEINRDELKKTMESWVITDTIEINQVKMIIVAKKPLPLRILIDVREPSEFEKGHINQENDDYEVPYSETWTVNIPRGILEFKIGDKNYWDNELWIEMPSIDEEIVVYSQTGKRSALAAQALLQLGYNNVTSLKGGYRKWLDPNAPEEEAVKSSGGCG